MDYKWFGCLIFMMILLEQTKGEKGRTPDARVVIRRDAGDTKNKTVEEQIQTITSLMNDVTNPVDYSTLKRAIMAFGIAAKPFTIFGAILGAFGHAVGAGLSDQTHKQVMQEFSKLHTEIVTVRHDVAELENVIKWESTKVQYIDIVRDLKEAIRLTDAMGQNERDNDTAAYDRHKKRLRDHCKCHNCYMAVTALFDGVVGQGEFHNNILDNHYNKSGGDRPQMAKLTTRLLQLLTGGITALTTYETAELGEDAAKDNEAELDRLMRLSEQKMNAALQKCVDNLKANMLKDMDVLIANGGSNTDLSRKIYDKVKAKYDWLDTIVAVYRGTDHDQLHAHGGNRVEQINKHGKNAVVLYREKAATPDTNSFRISNATYIANYFKDWGKQICQNICTNYYSAKMIYEHVENNRQHHNLIWFGVVVVRNFKQCPGTDFCTYLGEMAYTTEWTDTVNVQGKWNILIGVGRAK